MYEHRGDAGAERGRPDYVDAITEWLDVRIYTCIRTQPP